MPSMRMLALLSVTARVQAFTDDAALLQHLPRGSSEKIALTSSESSSGYCCFWSPNNADTCSDCQSQADESNHCSQSQYHCESDCNAVWCGSPTPSPEPTPLPTPLPTPQNEQIDDSQNDEPHDDASSPSPAPTRAPVLPTPSPTGGIDDDSTGDDSTNPSPAPLDTRCTSDRTPSDSKCSGCPPVFNGKPCASSSWYEDMTKAACGCSVPPGYSENVPAEWWTFTNYTAAINCANNNPSSPGQGGWCPSSCGQCYKLCTTGGTINNNVEVTAGECIVTKVTNNCADGYPSTNSTEQKDWCSQNIPYFDCAEDPTVCSQRGNTNMYGYPAHFDLMNIYYQITDGLGWHNPELTWEAVSCSEEFEGPSWDCQCDSSKCESFEDQAC